MAKAWVALIAFVFFSLPVAAAQGGPERSRNSSPAWSELTAQQREILAPLSKEWGELDATRRKKWIAIPKRYPKITPQAQERPQQRLAINRFAGLRLNVQKPAPSDAARNRIRAPLE